MASLVPSIIAKDFTDFQQKISFLEGRVERAHLDVVDGKFAPNISWGAPRILKTYTAESRVAVEAHLMMESPEISIREWARSSATRIFYHYESTENHEEIIEACKNAGADIGIALLPETPLDVLAQWIAHIDAVLLLGVNPGFYGSSFQEHVMEKIFALRKMYPNLIIEIDGGMNPQTARQAVQAGADLIVAGSYIFRSDDPKSAIEEMKRAISA